MLQNGIFRYHRSRAVLTHDHGAVIVHIQLQKPLEIDAGKHINPCIPSISFWSFLQSHPFMVISWAPGKQHTIDLLIDPQRGLTQELLYYAKKGHAMNPLVVSSGPHGISVEMDEYESILIVASGFGVAAHLPYLKNLVYGYNVRLVRARRTHLVWQIRDKCEILELSRVRPKPTKPADGIAAQSLLNETLQDDKLDDGCVCP
jgi:NAD(P)H-flavin reductase